MNKNILKNGVSICLLVSLTGCMGVLKPFPEVKEGTRNSATESFENAENYADELRNEYQNALSNQAALSTYGGLTLIGISSGMALLGGLGITGDAIVATGIGGTAVYSSTNFLSSPPRQRAYMMGFNALSCAVEVLRPLNFKNREKEQYAIFTGALKGMGSKIGEVEFKRKLFKIRLLQKEKTGLVSELKSFYEQENEDSIAEIKAAQSSLRDGKVRNIEIMAAPKLLTSAIDRIKGEVNAGVLSTIPSTASMQTIISSLGNVYSQFTAVHDEFSTFISEGSTAENEAGAVEGIATKSTETASIESAFSNLLGARKAMNIDKNVILDFTAGLAALRPGITLASCGVDPDSIIMPLTTATKDITFKAGANGSKQIAINGGVRPYSVVGALLDDEKISVRVPYPGAPFFEVIAKAPTAGNFAATIIDARTKSPQSVTVNIIINAVKEEKPVKTEFEEDEKEFLKAAFKNLKPVSNKKEVQKNICMPTASQDGILGADTYKKLLQSYPNTNIKSEKEAAEFFEQILKETDGKRCKK